MSVGETSYGLGHLVRPHKQMESPSKGLASLLALLVGALWLCLSLSTLEATQGHIDGFSSHIPCQYLQNRVASVGD